ncbi:Crp/Fnr family transcriptional regulator [Aliiglaciecola lipolytica]|uniref:Crp/FNR family transcriptional regulator n=1 Tax=Aliiglaciecola lipolytica E3 TaxID=1127673 RepID=K6WYC8_9ALTE|nr:Crp/Fnr family transcriptional regulator [Aliiglaciecola lipolytica]GAC13464.1 Crp/FNR family transcriptional regulator [Aliiglaciecola lipolytica E3]
MDILETEKLFIQNQWLEQLPQEVIHDLILVSKMKLLQKGQILHAKGDNAEGFYCVLEGKIRISNVNSQGKEMVLTWLESGTWFGEISMFDGLPRTHDAHAEEVTKLLMIPNVAFQCLLTQKPQFYPYFMRMLCQRIRVTFDLIDETGGLSLQRQLARRILLLVNGLHNTNKQTGSKRISISQESLAHMINSSRQTVNKLLNELNQLNIIQVHYGTIEIIDMRALERLCEI